MTLEEVRDTKKYRIHGGLEAFQVASRGDSDAARSDFGDLTRRVPDDPVPGYRADVRVNDADGQPYEIRFWKLERD